MNQADLVAWAVFAGMAWLLFASITGADEFLKSLVGRSKLHDLNQRLVELELRLEALEKK